MTHSETLNSTESEARPAFNSALGSTALQDTQETWQVGDVTLGSHTIWGDKSGSGFVTYAPPFEQDVI